MQLGHRKTPDAPFTGFLTPLLRPSASPASLSRRYWVVPTDLQPRAETPAHLRVLIVDDDVDVRSLLCTYVSRREHEPRGVSTMQEALNLLDTELFDVLVTDVLLPDGDGIDLLNHVAKEHPGIRVVVVTGGGRYFTAGFYRPIAQVLGAAVLQKPFERQEFLAAVEGVGSQL